MATAVSAAAAVPAAIAATTTTAAAPATDAKAPATTNGNTAATVAASGPDSTDGDGIRIDLISSLMVLSSHPDWVSQMHALYQHEWSAGNWPSNKALSDVQRLLRVPNNGMIVAIATVPAAAAATNATASSATTSDATDSKQSTAVAATATAAAPIVAGTRELIGFGTVTGNLKLDPLIEDVIVSSKWRHKRLGTRVLRAIVNYEPLLAGGVTCFELYCKPNVAPFYERNGFKPVREPINNKAFMRFVVPTAKK